MNMPYLNETAEMLVTVASPWKTPQGFRVVEIPTPKPCAHLYRVYDVRDVPVGEITHREVSPDARPFYFNTIVNGVEIKSYNYDTLEEATNDLVVLAQSLGF